MGDSHPLPAPFAPQVGRLGLCCTSQRRGELDETEATVETKGVSDKVSNASSGRPPKGKSKSAGQAVLMS